MGGVFLKRFYMELFLHLRVLQRGPNGRILYGAGLRISCESVVLCLNYTSPQAKLIYVCGKFEVAVYGKDFRHLLLYADLGASLTQLF